MTDTKIKLTKHQRGNLLRLADYLESLPKDYEHFNMRSFADHRGDCDLPMPEDLMAATRPKEFLSNCGTVACAAGHGPAAGVPLSPDERARMKAAAWTHSTVWSEYCGRAFGAGHRGYRGLFQFLFEGNWAAYDDHHYGAAARIRYALDRGVPQDKDNWHEPGQASERMVRLYARYRKGSRSVVRREIDAGKAVA